MSERREKGSGGEAYVDASALRAMNFSDTVLHSRIEGGRPGAWCLLLRHAERYPILPGDSVWTARLTTKGHRDAGLFGAALRDFALAGVYVSPVERCRETGRRLLEGWGHDAASIQDDPLLAGAYVAHRETVSQQYESRQPYRVILDHMAGTPVPGMLSLEDGSRRLLRWMMERMVPGRLTVCVSHDAVVMPFGWFFAKEEYDSVRWLPFLGNVAVYWDPCKGVEINGVTIDDDRGEVCV